MGEESDKNENWYDEITKPKSELSKIYKKIDGDDKLGIEPYDVKKDTISCTLYNISYGEKYSVEIMSSIFGMAQWKVLSKSCIVGGSKLYKVIGNLNDVLDLYKSICFCDGVYFNLKNITLPLPRGSDEDYTGRIPDELSKWITGNVTKKLGTSLAKGIRLCYLCGIREFGLSLSEKIPDHYICIGDGMLEEVESMVNITRDRYAGEIISWCRNNPDIFDRPFDYVFKFDSVLLNLLKEYGIYK